MSVFKNKTYNFEFRITDWEWIEIFTFKIYIFFLDEYGKRLDEYSTNRIQQNFFVLLNII